MQRKASPQPQTLKSPDRDKLHAWLDGMIGSGPKPQGMDQFCFPTQDMLDIYLSEIGAQSDRDVLALVRLLLIPSGRLGIDHHHLASLAHTLSQLATTTAGSDMSSVLTERLSEYDRRLLRSVQGDASRPPPWEGITWVIDLLPHWPQTAIDSISAYILAHAQLLPDARYSGMDDARTVIRARYIGVPGADVSDRVEMIAGLDSRDFERLVECYFAELGYVTELTPPRKDGGRDILAVKSEPLVECLVVECKNWRRRVGVPETRKLLGVVADEKATVGVLVGTSGFTGPAHKFADRNKLSLLGGTALVPELNAKLGSSWPVRIDRILDESRRRSP